MPDTPVAPPTPSLDDLQRCGADELLNQNPLATAYHELWSELCAAAQAAGQDAPKAAALTFLAKICSMMLEPDDRAASFKPMMSSPAGRTALPEDFTAAEVGLMADLAPTVQHPLLRARLCDLVWFKERRRGTAFAHMAIEGYRQPPIDDPKWSLEVVKYRQRAIQLAHSTGKGGGVLSAAIADELLGEFWKALEAGDHMPALRYLRPLQSERLLRDQAGQIAEALEREACGQVENRDPFSALLFAEGAVVWFTRAQDDERRATAQILVAECWVAQADKDGSGITTHHCYTKAIDAYRRISAKYRAKFGAADAIMQLRAKLPAAGQDMLARMKTVSHSVDITDLAAAAVGAVQGLKPDKALFAFCRIAPWPNLEALRREAEIPLRGIAALFSSTSVDEDGRVIAVEGGVDDADSRERRLAAEMIKASARRADIAARALIDPALDVIRQQFHLAPHDFYAIAQLSTLVPGDRTDLVAKGLYAGYCRDFIQAIHILMPQFEHMVRMVLKEAGAQTTSRQDDIEMELGLSALAELPQMKERFGEDLTFTIRALMCKPLGPNLRNQVAHGLAGSNLCNSGYGIYAWWLILMLVVEGFHMMQQAENENNPDNAEDG